MMPVPSVVLRPQPPVPVERGSWNCWPLTASVQTMPASTEPLAGEPATLDWQLVNGPLNPYVNGPVPVAVRPAPSNVAVPSSLQPPPDAADAGPTLAAHAANATTRTPARVNLRTFVPPLRTTKRRSSECRRQWAGSAPPSATRDRTDY